jgi:hypothetical protein
VAINLTTRDQVKTWLGITGSSADERIDLLIPAVSRRLERYLGRTDGIELRSRTELLASTPEIPSGKVFSYTTKVAPISSVASIKIDETRVFGASATTLTENEDFYVDGDQGVIVFDGYRPPEGFGEVQLVYTAGFAASTVNLLAEAKYADLTMGATMQVAYVFDRRNSVGATSENVNGATRSQPALDLLPDVISMLTPYRRIKL